MIALPEGDGGGVIGRHLNRSGAAARPHAGRVIGVRIWKYRSACESFKSPIANLVALVYCEPQTLINRLLESMGKSPFRI